MNYFAQRGNHFSRLKMNLFVCLFISFFSFPKLWSVYTWFHNSWCYFIIIRGVISMCCNLPVIDCHFVQPTHLSKAKCVWWKRLKIIWVNLNKDRENQRSKFTPPKNDGYGGDPLLNAACYKLLEIRRWTGISRRKVVDLRITHKKKYGVKCVGFVFLFLLYYFFHF